MSVFRFFKYSCGVLILAAVTACISAPVEIASPTLPPLTATPDLPATVVDTIRSAVTPTPVSRALTLTMWLPTAFNAEPIRQLLRQQLDAFATSEDGVPIEVLIKSDHGPGGLFDLLRTASPVAPGVLPDLIALDASELETTARTGLLQPIGPLLPANLVSDFFPFARGLGTINEVLYGVVYSADLEHLAYNQQLIDLAPSRWNEILTGTLTYVFALHDAEGHVSDSVLADYAALGGIFFDADGRPALNQIALTDLLARYQQVQREGVLPANVTQLESADAAWSAFLATKAALVNVRATRYLSVEQSLSNIQFAALPALDRPTQPVGRGWALGLVTREPRRQTAALKLLQWLLAPQNSGALTRALGTLPGRAAALTLWDQSDPYTAFIRDQLASARAAPPASIMNVVGPALRQAIDDVLTGRASPEQAAQTALTSLGAKRP